MAALPGFVTAVGDKPTQGLQRALATKLEEYATSSFAAFDGHSQEHQHHRSLGHATQLMDTSGSILEAAHRTCPPNNKVTSAQQLFQKAKRQARIAAGLL